MGSYNEMLQVFPANIRRILVGMYLEWEHLQEIRLRAGQPLMVVYKNKEYFINAKEGLSETEHISYLVSAGEIREMMEYVSHYSLYAFEEELRQGYITIRGGHRVGISGKAVVENGRIKGMKHISFLNVRFAHQVTGCADPVMSFVEADGNFYHTLIVSPPMCGKTTLLRDIIRQTSNSGKNVSVIDERSEIGACYQGVPSNDLGRRTDILDGCPKAVGMMMVIRSMAPAVIAVDEIGDKEDVEAIHYVMNCGCKLLATVHGESIEDLRQRPVLSELIEERLFERYIILKKSRMAGNISTVLDRDGACLKQFG